MPALANIRHELFARAIVASLAGNTRLEQAQSTAYIKAGYLCAPGPSAEASASRLLRRVKPVMDRVRELQEQLAKRKKLTLEDIVDELEEAREVARSTEQASAMVAATSTKAKVLGLSVERIEVTAKQAEQATSTDELAEMLLREANPGLQGAIGDEVRNAALNELARHAEAMHAIAHGHAVLEHA